MLSFKKIDRLPKDLGASWIKYDNEQIENAYLMYRETLINICSGLEAPENIQMDLLNAFEKEKQEVDNFLKLNLQTCEISFFSPIKELKLKTFKDTLIKRMCNVKAKSVTIAAERSMFGKILMREVLKYSLGPLPWSFALPDGGLVKTDKSKLLAAVENDIPPLFVLPDICASVVDGMVIIRQMDVSRMSTFGEFSKCILERVLKMGTGQSIYFVTDQYKQNSIKGYERSRRALSDVMKYKIERREQNLPKHFKRFLGGGENQEELVKFLCKDWGSSDDYKPLINDHSLFVNVCDMFFLIKQENGRIKMTELTTSQEEADTKVFVCCAHARDGGFASACTFTVDSDIPLYALYFKEHIGMDMFVEIGVKNTRRRISISAIFNFHGPSVSTSITALHSFTGNDYIGSFVYLILMLLYISA